ncbi:hypothetical protein BS329_15930 [Amycolatopsis coloradensis]|uniref:Uncharacterized protein n=1 Tax=Amycolatopsis coloradensis TaxID=76021 RepID=A0A1R0KUG7_9PSEU|nr:hypothetical protein [Amycolatopsis coloradensis]OLZ51748.1 hypothetical protein BS329_15930 [Amycolatopsis coloradensis]
MLRELGLTLGYGGAVLALPGLSVWLAIEILLIGGATRDEVRHLFRGLTHVLPHVVFGVLVVFVLQLLASVIRVMNRPQRAHQDLSRSTT